jgi:hypothetical protein
MIATALTGQNVSVGNLTVSTNINAPFISQSGANNVSIELSAAAGIIAITSSGNATQFLPSGTINLGGTSTINGGVFAGSGFTAGASQTDLFQNRGGDVTIQVGTGGSISKTWTFANNGNLTTPGNVTISGNLIVNGSTTTISSTNLEVTDKNITIAKGAADSSAADGAGITVDGANASLNYSHSGTKWVANKPFNISDATASTSTSTGALIVAGGVGITGNIVASGQVTAADINSSSDSRLKKNIKTVKSALDTVNALRGVTFEWKEGNGKAIGLIAQEVQGVLPEIVSTDDNGYLGIRYTNVVGVLVEAIKELKADFEAYKKTHP